MATGIGVVVASVAIVQPAVAQITQIDGIQIRPVNGTLEIRLETTEGRTPQAFTTSYGRTVIIDLISTQLNLPDRDRILQDNPADGIESIRVEPLDTNSVRITIVGRDRAPTATLTPDTGTLVVAVSTAEVTAEQPPEAPTDEATPDAPPTPEDDTLRVIVTGEEDEDYLVPEATTGTRTETPIFEVPQAIQVIPERILEDQQVIRLNDAIRNTPNAVQGNTFGTTGDEFVIRGFDGATVLRDGFRVDPALTPGSLEELANVERVEILRGPASILFGNIEPGGVINLVTKEPLSEPFYSLEFQAGSFGLLRPQLDITGSLVDGLQYRLNAVYERGEGFRDFDTEIERFFIAPVLKWDVNDNTELIFEFNYLDDERPFDRGIPAVGGEVVDVPIETIFGEPDDFAEVDVVTASYRLEHRLSDRWQIRNRFRYTETRFSFTTSRSQRCRSAHWNAISCLY
ncbi:TonB-dependent receptor plug domain-containing protein [bacterium]|nr:TonB-dependent receptor plug domain-containing protein [bacterium]